MNLYICSTLRHLIFSVAKASCDIDSKSHIIFFSDYQNIEKDRLNISNLPKNIDIIICKRSDLISHLKQNKCKFILWLSKWNPAYNLSIKKRLTLLLSNFFHIDANSFNELNLFVFNDKNKMSRLFRLLVDNYEVIEDGVGNYYHIPLSNKVKSIGRFLIGKNSSYWLIGEDKRCKAINVIFPEKLPKEIINKGKKFDFMSDKSALTCINSIFNFTPRLKRGCIILATQPISSDLRSKLIAPNYALELHAQIAKYFIDNSIEVMVKLHPSEEIETYLPYFSKEQFLETKYPLEIEIFNANEEVTIASLNSTAGLGFESFCVRKKLIHDDDMGKFQQIILDWEKHPEKLKSRMEEIFK